MLSRTVRPGVTHGKLLVGPDRPVSGLLTGVATVSRPASTGNGQKDRWPPSRIESARNDLSLAVCLPFAFPGFQLLRSMFGKDSPGAPVAYRTALEPRLHTGLSTIAACGQALRIHNQGFTEFSEEDIFTADSTCERKLRWPEAPYTACLMNN